MKKIWSACRTLTAREAATGDGEVLCGTAPCLPSPRDVQGKMRRRRCGAIMVPVN